MESPALTIEQQRELLRRQCVGWTISDLLREEKFQSMSTEELLQHAEQIVAKRFAQKLHGPLPAENP